MIKQKVFSLNFGDSEIENNHDAYELFTKTYKDGLFLLNKMTNSTTKIGVPVLLGSITLAIDIDTDELFAYKLFYKRGLPFDVKLANVSGFNKVKGSLIIDDQRSYVIYFGNIPDESEYAECLLQIPNCISPDGGLSRVDMDQPDPLRARGRRSNYVYADYPYGEQEPARYIADDGSPLELVPMSVAYKEEDEEPKYRGGESDGGGSTSSWGDEGSSSNDDSNDSGNSDD